MIPWFSMKFWCQELFPGQSKIAFNQNTSVQRYIMAKLSGSAGQWLVSCWSMRLSAANPIHLPEHLSLWPESEAMQWRWPCPTTWAISWLSNTFSARNQLSCSCYAGWTLSHCKVAERDSILEPNQLQTYSINFSQCHCIFSSFDE